MQARITLAMAFLATSLVTGCGQKGPLYRDAPLRLAPAEFETEVKASVETETDRETAVTGTSKQE
ncbi:LPS translocon maturation chaperone LptM [Marinobacter caseinilyticus]|uniref:LPS translocon maturation chaperone LptM n=1 Tax=Marinobacter caseinilyticus TaxID=2692195 RepID=UPI00140C9C0C|nr:lipoprotein [Marinobacter caseinilyticus]